MMQKWNKNEVKVQLTVFFKTAGKTFPVLKKEWSSVKKLVYVTPGVTLISQKHVNLWKYVIYILAHFLRWKCKFEARNTVNFIIKIQFWIFLIVCKFERVINEFTIAPVLNFKWGKSLYSRSIVFVRDIILRMLGVLLRNMTSYF